MTDYIKGNLENKTINYINGDLFSVTKGLIAHGCNTKGVMGSGVARIVKEKYPVAFEVYQAACNEVSESDNWYPILGQCIIAKATPDLHIANLITQESYGSGLGIRFVSYDAVDNSIQKLSLFMRDFGFKEVSMPLIGAGLGGGNWNVIEAIIKSNFDNTGLIVNVYYL